VEDYCCTRHSVAPTWESDNGVIVAAFRLGPDGQLSPAPGQRIRPPAGARGLPTPSAGPPADRRPGDVVWPDDCVFAVFPQRQPRPGRDVAASQAGAALLTPITVCADVGVGILFVPLGAFMLAIGYHGC
jgi:hypothetical protein